MPIVDVSPGTLGTAGVSVAFQATQDVEAPESIQTTGLPITFRVPDPTPQTSPDAVRARVLDASGTFICHLPHTQGLRWTDEHNTAGAGSIDVRRYDDLETKHPTVWAPYNQILISVGDPDVFRLILDALPSYRIDPDTGQRIDARAGTGALGVLNAGMCIPEYGWRPEATEDRTFDYGSNPAIGGWYVASEWRTPIGRLIRNSWRWIYKKRHLPKGLRDKKAQWLWYRDPDSTSSANETCYLIYSFTISQARRIRFKYGGDDACEFQVDGEIRGTTGPGGWKRISTLVMHLSAGTHYVAAKVTNTPGSTGNANRSGFICSIARIDGNGDVISWINHSSPSTWKIRRQLSSAPGWFAAQILRQLVQEQKDRGCAGHSPVTFGFSTTADSAGVAWADRRELSITVGTNALDYIQQLVETGIDVAMTPGLTLNAWRSRGADRSGWVRLDQGAGHKLDESAGQAPTTRNFAAAKASTGWVTQSDAGSISANGLRETLMSLGSSQSPQQTAASVASMLPDLANPLQTIEVKLSGATAKWRPYIDYFPGDWVSYKPAGASTWGRHKVVSIAGEVNDAGHADWTLQLHGG